METILSAKALYEKLKDQREPYITRAVKNAEVTLPILFTKEGTEGGTNLETPWNSIGARGINNLSSKLMLALFPPNEKFFRLGLTPEMKAQLVQQPDKIAEAEQVLSNIEDTVIRAIEENQIRITIQEGILQLLVAGNALLFLPPKENGSRLYSLKNYVIERDAIGNILTIVTQDKIAKKALPTEIQNMLSGDYKPESLISIYTHVSLEEDKYVSYQEIEEKRIPSSEQIYPKDKSPYIPLRMTKQDGESYGRSFVEEYYGDLLSLAKLSKALNETAMLSATTLFLVNPNGITRPRQLQDAMNGDFVTGRASDIEALQLNKFPDLNIAYQHIGGIEQRLSFVFLLSSVVQRNAERVTAEEVRMVARELEDTLGSVYAILTQELQLPLIKRLLAKLMSNNQVVQLPDGFIEPTITTGMEALGRGHDFNKFTTFVQIISQLPNAIQYLHMDSWVTSIATSLGIDTQGLIKTREELQQEMEEAQAQQLAMQGVSSAIEGEMQ